MTDCVKQFNCFCYICGKFTTERSRRTITSDIKDLYEEYFNLPVNENVDWAPSIVCSSCTGRLSDWFNEKRPSMPFGVPMVWDNPFMHFAPDCFACVNYFHGMNKRKVQNITLKATRWAQLPIKHSASIPIPVSKKKKTSPLAESIAPSLPVESVPESMISLYEPSNVTPPCPHVEYKQDTLDILIRSLKLSQRKSIILAKDLKEKKLLSSGANVYAARGRQRKFTNFFTSIEHNSFAYCHDIQRLVLSMHREYKPTEWRLFIDSSKRSLKAVLLHESNSISPVPIALSRNTKENYLSMKKIIEMVNYCDHQWKICADLKVVTLLRGMQTGYTKNMCFMCMWDTRYKGDQYQKRDWELREQHLLRHGNVIEEPLVPIDKILLPPLHIKLGIVKNFICIFNAFAELSRIFPGLSTMKIKEGSWRAFQMTLYTKLISLHCYRGSEWTRH